MIAELGELRMAGSVEDWLIFVTVHDVKFTEKSASEPALMEELNDE